MRAARSRTYQIVLDQIRKHRSTIILSVLLVMIATALDVVTPLFFRFLIDQAVPSRDVGLIAGVVAGTILLPVISAALTYLEGHQRNKIGTSVTQALRQEAFEHMLSMRMDHLERLNSGELLQLVTRTCGEIGDVFVGDSLLPTISRSFFLIGNVIAMFAINGRLALATMLAVPTLYIFSRLIRRRMLRLDEQFYAMVEAGSSLAHETLAGLRTIRAANGQQRAAGLWRGWAERYRQSKLAISALHGFYVDTLSSFLNNLVLAIVLGLGVFEILGNRMSIGTLIAFLVYAPRVLSSLQQFTRTQLGVSTMRVAAGKLNAHFALPPERSHGAMLPVSPASQSGVKITFEDISFHYGRGEAGVNHLSFEVSPGEFVGIVGPSGGGKSTIFDLLTGFYDPDEGRIRIDDMDMQRLSLLAIREAMGVVFQDTFLWNMSLLENLTYPRDAADIPDVGWAVRAAALEPFIAGLPAGLKTVVGERGHSLSGGERQRIAVARAVLRNPRLLLLDEATSALDPLTEEKLRHALESLRQGRTTIVIAHRLATIAQADRIIVIDKGRVVEQGTPADLLARRGLYYAFYQAQKLD